MSLPSASERNAACTEAGSRAVAARVEDALADALAADVVLVNPPRGGLDPRVPATLERAAHGGHGSAPRAVIYVSCNPATLARDLARMPAWAIRSVQPFDMFPQTAHVETLVELVPASDVTTDTESQPVEPRA